jgi:FtsP/CotA-like multicopper oxidase with cupredoxin domain
MGQAPGTHWYHAHKHGSTTINVANGMTGVFVIEGPYDDALSNYYGGGPAAPQGWTRTQPVMVINQLGTVPNLFAGSGGPLPLSVNGSIQPTIKMRPGEVQMWRIANTASRSGVYFSGFYPEPRPADPAPWNPAPFKWKQLAQDGVQFHPDVYDASNNPNILLASGNRADLLVQAPANTTGQPQLYSLQIQDVVSRSRITPGVATPNALLLVQVEAAPPVTGNQSTFIPKDKLDPLPPFLKDIKPEDVRGTKTITFATQAPAQPPLPNNPARFDKHMIDGKPFDGNVGEVVLLNTVEEWKIENATLAPPIDHPFHIHINPFQIVEVFDPKEKVTNSSGQVVAKYVITTDSSQTAPDPATQCLVNPDKRETWVDCHRAERPNNIWWDVFPIPMAVSGTKSDNTKVTIPGYFKMRSRFVDYTGQYVIHCHILAHEDRGMMTVVEVVPFKTPYSHQ